MPVWRLTITRRPNNHFLNIAGAWGFMTENVQGIGQIFNLGHKHKQRWKKDICILFPGNGFGCNGLVGWVAFLNCYYSRSNIVFIVHRERPCGNVHIGGCTVG